MSRWQRRRPIEENDREPYRISGRPTLLWDCSLVLSRVAAVITLMATLLLLFNSSLHLGKFLVAVLPAGVVRYFTTDAPVIAPTVIRDVESKISRELKEATKSPRKEAGPEAPSFGMGSTKKEVLSAQGSPTSTGDNLWRYGQSEIYFVAGRVVGWRTSAENP